MVLFVRQTGREKEGKNELKRIKECMQLRKVGMHEVVKDKAMENGLQDMDDQYALNE
jgi:hypothetical protein